MADTPLTNLDTVISTDRTAAGSQPDFSTPTGTTGTGGGGGSPTGAAGGDLGGSYPNPTVLGMTANTVTLTLGNINAGQYLLRSGSTIIGGTPSGAGNVNGPASSVNNHVALFNGTSGTAIKDSGVTLTAGAGTPALTVNGTADVSGTNTGDQTNITGNAGTASALNPGATINSVSFTGTAAITVYDATKLPLAGGAMTGAIAMGANKITGLANGTASTDAAAFGQIPSSLPPSGAAGGELSGTYPNPQVNLLHTNTAVHTAFMGPISGSGLPTFRAIDPSDIPTLNQNTTGSAGSVPYSGLTGTVPTWNQNTTGNAASATILQTTRTINSVAFNGSANITIADDTKLPLAGGTMSGAINMGASKINNLSNGTVATDAAAFGQIPTALPPNGAASGSLGGSYPSPTVTAINETSGPTKLTIGTVSDGQVLKRVGITLVGATVGTGDVTGPAGSIAGRVATFSTTSGKVIQDSGVSLTAGTGSPALTVNGTASISGTNFGIPTAAGTQYARLGRNTASALIASTDLTWYGPDVYNVKDYGAAGNGGDDSTAINAAITAINSSTYGGCLYFPAGTYGMGTTALTTITKPVKIQGDGVSVTVISLAATLGGFSMDYSSAAGPQFASAYDFTIKTANATAAQTALTFKQKSGGTTKPSFEFSTLSIEGCWSKGIFINNAALNDSQGGTIRDVALVGVQGATTGFGYGIYIAGASNINVTGVKLTEGTVGCYIASSPACEGVWVSDSIFVNTKYGIQAPGANSWLSNVHVNVSSVYAVGAGIGFYVTGNQSILTSCYVLTDDSSTVGFNINATEVNMTNCLALRTSGTMTNGVVMGSSCGQCVISNNHFQAISGPAIICGGHNNLVEGNYYTDCSATYPINDTTGLNNVCINNFSSNSAKASATSASTSPVGYTASATWDPASLAPGQQDFLAVTAPGAAFGQGWVVGVPYHLQNMIAVAFVLATGFVRITVFNSSGGTVDLGSGTWTVTRVS